MKETHLAQGTWSDAFSSSTNTCRLEGSNSHEPSANSKIKSCSKNHPNHHSIIIIPDLPCWRFLTTSATTHQVFTMCILHRGWFGLIQEIVKVCFPPLQNIPSKTSAVLLPGEHNPSCVIDLLPQLQGQLKRFFFFLYSPTKQFPLDFFSSTTTKPAVLLALWYPSPPFDIPWANQAQNCLFCLIASSQHAQVTVWQYLLLVTISSFKHDPSRSCSFFRLICDKLGLFIDASTKSNFWQTTEICMWPTFWNKAKIKIKSSQYTNSVQNAVILPTQTAHIDPVFCHKPMFLLFST